MHPFSLAERICNLCAKGNDLQDYELCSSCCYALVQVQEKPEFPDGFDNVVGWICRKAGVGTLPILFVMAEEAALTHFMHHYVFLPTPIGIEIAEFAKKVGVRLKIQSGPALSSTLSKLQLSIFKRNTSP